MWRKLLLLAPFGLMSAVGFGGFMFFALFGVGNMNDQIGIGLSATLWIGSMIGMDILDTYIHKVLRRSKEQQSGVGK